MLGPLNTVRAAAGAPPVRSADDFARRPPLILVADGEPFEYPHPDWGDDVQLIGPCDFDPPGDPPKTTSIGSSCWCRSPPSPNTTSL